MNKEEKKPIKIAVEVNNINRKEIETDTAIVSYDNNCILVGKLNPNDLLYNTCLMAHTVYTTINKIITVTPETFMDKLYSGMMEMLEKPDLINTDHNIYTNEPLAIDIQELLRQMGENNENL